MKKLVLTIAIILGLGLTTFAQDETFGGGGLLQRGETRYDYFADWADLGWTRTTGLFNLPGQHGLANDQNATPLGSGALLLIGFGAAYVGLKRKNRINKR